MKIIIIRPVSRDEIYKPNTYLDIDRRHVRKIYYSIPCILLRSIKSNNEDNKVQQT